MQKIKRTEFAAEMSKLRAKYQNAVTDEGLWLASIATYWEVCCDYEANHIRTAFATAWRRYPDWMPSCGQLVELIEAGHPTAAEAWPELLKIAARSSGDHSDPIAREVIRLMGGGKRLGSMAVGELAIWGRKQFEVLYEEVQNGVQSQETRLRVEDAHDDVKKLAGNVARELEA